MKNNMNNIRIIHGDILEEDNCSEFSVNKKEFDKEIHWCYFYKKF